MKPVLSARTPRSGDTQQADSHDGDISDLIFAFDDDLEKERDSLSIPPLRLDSSGSPRSASPISWASQLGYVMIPYPDTSVQGEDTSTNIHTVDTTATWSQVTRKGNGRAMPTPYSPADYGKAAASQQGPPSPYPSPTQEQTHTRISEPTTPRTRHFRDNMLSLLSLLPSERYLSPSPSVHDDHFDDIDTRGHTPDSCPVTLDRPGQVHATADFPARSRPLFPPPTLTPGLSPCRGRSHESLDDAS